MRQIRIAAQLHPQHGAWRDLRAAAVRAEELGFDIVYTWDHFFPLYGPADGAHFECWSMLAALAEATEGVEIGPLVTCNSYRNPQLLADMVRTVDHISGGRVINGIGAGWNERDYREYGYAFGSIGERLGALEAAIPVILERLERLNPPPVRRIPLLIAGTGLRRTLRLVARYADAWHAAFPDAPEELEPAIAALRRHCADVGRDPREIEWSVGVEPDQLETFLARDAETYVEMGFSQFTLGFNGPSWTVDAAAPWLRWRDALNREHVAAAASPAAG
jgi:probable F420-dependent oxidoreductase